MFRQGHTLDIPKPLIEALQENEVIPFIGAGVSMAVLHAETGKPLFPSWKELLEHAAEKLHKTRSSHAKLVEGFLEENEFLESATKAKKGLDGQWSDFLKSQFDVNTKDVNKESLRLAQAVWKLGSQLVITTNYDNIMNWSNPFPSDTARWVIASIAEQAKSLRTPVTKPTVWHLHGHIDNTDDIILTKDSYKLFYDGSAHEESPYHGSLNALQTLLTSHTFLFIGYGIEDDPLLEQLEFIQKIFKGYSAQHYALINETKIDLFNAKKLNSIKAIPFKGHGDPLLEVMKELADYADTTPTPEMSSPASPQTPSVANFSPDNPARNIPYNPKGDQVIGRDAVLKRIHKQLNQGNATVHGNTAALQGTGGLGKTQMAIEYAWEYSNEYPAGVIWINADQDIDTQLTALARKSEWVSPHTESKIIYELALKRVKSFSDGLIIFDNVEDSNAIRDYLPDPSNNVHILITSIINQRGYSKVDFDVLTLDQAKEMLIQESQREAESEEDEAALLEIAAELSGIPLALEAVGGFINERSNITWAEYAVELKERFEEALKLAATLDMASFTKHDKDIFKTLKLSKELIAKEPLLPEVLHSLAWSGTSSMSIDLLKNMLDLESTMQLKNALGRGINLKLIKVDEGDRYTIHRLIQRVQRLEHPLDKHQDWGEDMIERLGDWFHTHRLEIDDLSLYEAEIDHLKAWLKNLGEQHPFHKARLLWLQAYPSYHRGQNEKSQSWLQQAQESLKEAQESDAKQVLHAHILNDLGYIAYKFEGHQKALEYEEKSLAIRREYLGDKHRDTAESLNNLGVTYRNLKNYQKALVYHQEALAIRRECLGDKHLDTAQSLTNLAVTYSELGNSKEALPHHQKALAIRRKSLVENHPETALSVYNCAVVHARLGDGRKKGLPLLNLALKDLPSDDPLYKNIKELQSDIKKGKYNKKKR